jgi:hypothetical protein
MARRIDRGIRASLRVGFFVLGIICALALDHVANASEGLEGVSELTVAFGALFVVAIGFAYYALPRYPKVSHLPFLWVLLVMIEFVISPLYDIFLDLYPFSSQHWVWAMSRAVEVCALSTAGLWLALALHDHLKASNDYPVESGDRTLRPANRALFIILVSAAIAAVAEIYIVAISGAAEGDITSARGSGLIGTSILMPIERLADIGTLMGSWLSVHAVERRARRAFLGVSFVCLLVALIVPVMLQQRFGIMQSFLYFAYPRLSTGTWLGPRARVLMYIFLPFVLFAAFSLNTLTSSLRYLSISDTRVSIPEMLDKAIEDNNATHFRHMQLLANLIEKGLDEKAFGGLWEDVTPFWGDMLLVLPRALFPEKPLTTMEVVNSVDVGRQFTAKNRGEKSVETASLWTQLYILGGLWGILPLTFLFGLLGMLSWNWAMARSSSPALLIMAAVLWLNFGWLSLNVCFTFMDAPGMLLGMSLYALAPPISRSRPRLSMRPTIVASA